MGLLSQRMHKGGLCGAMEGCLVITQTGFFFSPKFSVGKNFSCKKNMFVVKLNYELTGEVSEWFKVRISKVCVG